MRGVPVWRSDLLLLQSRGTEFPDLKISGSAGILPALRAAIARTLRAGCPRSWVLNGFRVPRAAERNALAKVAAEIKHQLQAAKS
jgi:hypothetical protein